MLLNMNKEYAYFERNGKNKMNYDLIIDEYFKKYNDIYNSSVERNIFEEICSHYGLIKKDENTYILPEEKLTIVKDRDSYQLQNRNLTITSKDNHIEASFIPVEEAMKSSSIIDFVYQYYYSIVKNAFYPLENGNATIYSLRGLILFLELIKYYSYSDNLSPNERANENEILNKRIKRMIN